MTRLLISVLALQIGVLLAVRPLVWWYLGVGRMVRALENIDMSLRSLPAVRDHDARFGRPRRRVA